jgi:hypothetical protein
VLIPQVIVHHADTLDGVRRDWRLLTGQKPCPTISVDGACVHPVLWHKANATEIASNTFTYSMENIPDRWRAFLIEVTSN